MTHVSTVPLVALPNILGQCSLGVPCAIRRAVIVSRNVKMSEVAAVKYSSGSRLGSQLAEKLLVVGFVPTGGIPRISDLGGER